MKYIFSLLFIISFSQVAYAQKQIDYEKMYSECIDKIGTINNSVVYECAGKTFEASENEIKSLYKKIFSRLSKESIKDAKKFKESQQLWYKYRQYTCDLATIYIGSPMYSYCPMKKNIIRVEELREFNN